MEDVIKIASYICQRYEYQFGTRIDEIKLQILLYFTQRECMVETGQPLFSDSFVAMGKYPVVLSVSRTYKANALGHEDSKCFHIKYPSVFDHVFKTYAGKDIIGLMTLMQSEYSWKKAKEVYSLTHEILISDITKDAERIRNRRFLLKHLADFRKQVYESKDVKPGGETVTIS